MPYLYSGHSFKEWLVYSTNSAQVWPKLSLLGISMFFILHFKPLHFQDLQWWIFQYKFIIIIYEVVYLRMFWTFHIYLTHGCWEHPSCTVAFLLLQLHKSLWPEHLPIVHTRRLEYYVSWCLHNSFLLASFQINISHTIISNNKCPTILGLDFCLE